jgi:hypothetical protein
LLVLVLVALPLLTPGQASAAPPPGSISPNVEYVATIPQLRQAIALNFIDDTMFVSTAAGLYSYDVSDPAAPELTGALPMYIWENEDMDVDPVRKRVFISRDPRGFTTSATPGALFPFGAVHIIDVSDPAAMVQAGFFTVPAGHTSTCINDCDFLWTGGPYANAQTQAGWTGRPIFATDVTDPRNPQACPNPIDLGRNDGVTDYAHDVQVDADGVAWVSGAGGVRGYWTEGDHLNPLTGQVETATACSPIPAAGGGTPSEATPSRFMHNSWRNVNATIPGGDDPDTAEDETLGQVLYGTEENITSNCASSGRFATYDLRGSWNGEGWKDIADTKFRMTPLDTWTPRKADDSGFEDGATACASAHYLDDRGDGILAYAFYGQGTRFLDVSDPTDIRQIGYFRPDGASTWAPYWRQVGEEWFVFIADSARGVDIVKFTGSAGTTPTVAPPPLQAAARAPQLKMDERLGYLCPLKS